MNDDFPVDRQDFLADIPEVVLVLGTSVDEDQVSLGH